MQVKKTKKNLNMP